MEQGSPSITVDLDNLAATIALASEALTAAAEALAEAATAISDANNTFDMFSTPEIKRDIRYPVISPEAPVHKGESRTDNKCGDLQSQIDQYGLANDQDESRFEYGIPATSSPPRSGISISSDSSSEVELVPVNEPLEKPFSAHELRHETNDNSPKTDDTPESGLNNKLDAPPPSSVDLASNEPEIVTNAPVADIALASLQSLVNSLKSYPVIPPGRNYMHLDHESDAFAFIAYMTLQFHRIICLVPEQLMDICLKSLQYLVDVNVYRVNSFSQFRSQSVAFGAVSKPNMCNLMLVPPLFLNFVSSTFISPDCVLHWGQPSSAYRWVNQVLAFIKPTVRVCVMIVEEQSFDGVPYGVAPYSNAVLATCQKPNSPFQLLRQTSTSLLPRVDHPPLRESQDPVSQSNSHLSGSSSTSVLSTAHDWVTNANTFWVGKPLADGLPMMNGARVKEPRLLKAMSSHTAIPPGRNYIHLDNASDALAFVAYMAMQAHRIVCVVPSQRQDACAKLLKSITHANIHLIDTPKQYDNLSTTLGTLNHTSYDILLTPCGDFTLNTRWVQQSKPDCILHWSQPANAYFFTTRRVVKSLARDARACVLVVGESAFDGKSHGVEPYPSSILNRCFQSDSPFQMLRQISSQLVPLVPTVQVTSRTQVLKQPSKPRPFELTKPRIRPSGTSASPPVEHHYIIVDQASDIDIISISACIALNIKKSICYIPDGRDLSRIHMLMNRIANVAVIAPTVLNGKPFKNTLKSFKSQKSGVWLRRISSEWSSFWAKSLVDCVIYWGVPSDLAYYSNECELKVNTSYLILTPEQQSSIQPQLNARGITQHPYIQASDATRPGTLLYDLRQKLIPLL